MIISTETSQTHDPQSPTNLDSEADFKSDELEELPQFIDTLVSPENGFPSLIKY